MITVSGDTAGAAPGEMIECRRVVELVTDYLEGQLDESTRLEFEAHLALCSGCAEYLAQLRATLDAVGQIPLDTLSDRAMEDLIAAFRNVR